MADEEGAFETSRDQRDVLPWEDKRRFQKIYTEQAVRSYLYLSFGMGAIAALLPILLLMTGGYNSHYSISFFYHVNDVSRNVLVGSLWATGMFLFLFHGLSKLENWILNLAGAAAISVAMNPMAATQCEDGHGNAFSIHAASAIFFFLCLATVAVLLSKGRVKHIIYPPKRRRFMVAYNVAGAAMIAMPLIVAAIHFLDGARCESHTVFWIETLGIWAFAFYWFVKTFEYKLLLRIHWTEGSRRRARAS